MLQFLERLASSVWDVVYRATALLIPPPYQTPKQWGGWSTTWKWTIHTFLLVGLLALLWWVNRCTSLDQILLAPNKRLRDYWLPLLGLNCYAIVWLAWWLCHLAGPEHTSSAFTDIDKAWDEAQTALAAKGINLTDAPLFLVLGKSLAGDGVLFGATQLAFSVKNAPPDDSAPLRVYAHPENGIYVCCAGASLLGKQSELLAEAKSFVEDNGPEVCPFNWEGVAASSPTIGADGFLWLANSLAKARQEQESKSRSSLLGNIDAVARLTARLKYLCNLIRRDRYPYCPVNGILLLVPFARVDNDRDAEQTGSIIRQDLATVA
jgi:hypothetical protein